MTDRSAVLHAASTLSIEDRPVPNPGRGQVPARRSSSPRRRRSMALSASSSPSTPPSPMPFPPVSATSKRRWPSQCRSGVWAARKAQISPGDRVLVTGAGPIGLLAAQVAPGVRGQQRHGDRPQPVSSGHRSATRSGHPASQRATHGGLRRPARMLRLPGRAHHRNAGAGPREPRRACRNGADTVAINVPLIQGHEITITGTFRYANTYPLALQLIASGAVNVDKVITHRFGIEAPRGAHPQPHRTGIPEGDGATPSVTQSRFSRVQRLRAHETARPRPGRRCRLARKIRQPDRGSRPAPGG
jgi:hypothetical protein